MRLTSVVSKGFQIHKKIHVIQQLKSIRTFHEIKKVFHLNRKVLKKSLEKFTLMKKRAGFSELELDTFQAGEATKKNYL